MPVTRADKIDSDSAPVDRRNVKDTSVKPGLKSFRRRPHCNQTIDSSVSYPPSEKDGEKIEAQEKTAFLTEKRNNEKNIGEKVYPEKHFREKTYGSLARDLTFTSLTSQHHLADKDASCSLIFQDDLEKQVSTLMTLD